MKIFKLIRTHAIAQQSGFQEQPADTIAVALEGQPLTVTLTPEQVRELSTYPYGIALRWQDV